MWGYSLEDLAKRASEEAAKLAEQAAEQASALAEQAGTFNLDTMNADAADQEQQTQPLATPQPQPTSTASVKARPFHTEPPRQANENLTAAAVDGGNTDHISTLVSSANATSPNRKAAATKLEVTDDDDMGGFDDWGEDEPDFDDSRNDAAAAQANDSDLVAEKMREESRRMAEQIVAEESDLAAEKMREESRRIAEQIMLEEQQKEKARKREQERVEAERLAAERAEQERLERERIAKEEEARQVVAEEARLEAERLAAEEAARQEAERLAAEEEAQRLEQERVEAERLAAEEAERKRLEQERIEAEKLEQERLAAEEAARQEAERLEQERLAAEEEAQRLEQERVEAERLAAEEAERKLLEQERIEAERLEQERLAAEEAARQEAEWLEQERLAAEEEAQRLEQERVEAERLAAEEAERKLLEQERIEAERLEQERLAAEEAARQVAEAERLAAEEAERECIEQERLAVEKQVVAQSLLAETDTGGQGWEEDDLDDMYDDDDDDDDEDKDQQEIIESAATERPVAATDDSKLAETKPAIQTDDDRKQSAETAPEEAGFFDAAAAVTSTSTSLSTMWDTTGASELFNEASKAGSMWGSWGYNGNSDTPAGKPESDPKPVMAPAEREKNNTDNVLESSTSDPNHGEASDEVAAEENDAARLQPTNHATDDSDAGNIPGNQQVLQHSVDQFVKQLERMTESHQLEMDEMQRTHKQEVDRLERELLSEREAKKKAKARDEVASQDKFLKQIRDLEKKWQGEIKEKEDALEEALRRNEGSGLKMDTLQREVDGLRKIVDDRDEEILKLTQGHGSTMMQVEGQVKSSQVELTRKDNEINELKNSVSALQSDLDATSEAYDTLKARAKAVATELKDRRIEVRTLTAENEELTTSNTSMDTQLSNLRALVNQHEITLGYKDKDMEALGEKVKELNKQIEQGTVKSLQDRSVGEKAIQSYKRKAQEALAAANSRLAAANQAREEAENDAKNAKSASDDAVERARIAELKKSEAEEKAVDITTLLESEREKASSDTNELNDTITGLKETIHLLQSEAEEAADARGKFVAELEELNSKLTSQQEKSKDLRQQLIGSNNLCESLQKEVEDLTDEVQRSSAAAFKRAKDNGEGNNADNQTDTTGTNVPNKDSSTEESDGTIIMLQQELQGANEAIAELKLALRSSLLEKVDDRGRGDPASSGMGLESYPTDTHANGAMSGNESTPLFFAIEKQNELKTARDEINRLANMLIDAESEKQEAFDAMHEMRQNMEEANSRLLRYEKLGMNPSNRPTLSQQSSYGPFRASAASAGHLSSGVLNDDSVATRMANAGNDSVVNLEYLKNVMLSFLTAKTLADRRKLVPVVATVLCLTPEEQRQAISSVEQTAGLTGVASSLWENIESKAHNLM